MSELCSYFPSNPDPTGVAGCLNTGNNEDGVVFPGIEVLEATTCYIGRTSLIEAVSLLYDTTPQRVLDLLTGDKFTAAEVKKQRVKITELEARLAEAADYCARAGKCLA